MKVLTIKVKNLKDLFAQAKSEVGINEPEAIFYDSIDAFSKSLSHQKIHILTIIKNKKPESISELVRHSPTLKRERASLICSQLEAEGYIKFSESTQGRKVPELTFDYDAIYVEETGHTILIKSLGLKEVTALKPKKKQTA